MPRWDYKCPVCGHVYERFSTNVAEAEAQPAYHITNQHGAVKMERQFPSTTFRLMGGPWHGNY